MGLLEILDGQRRFFKANKTKPVKFRLEALKRLRASIYRYEDKIYDALWKDLHRSKEQAYITETGLCLQETRLFIKNLKKWARPRGKASSLMFPLSKCFVKPEPFGVVLVISPWNYPIFLSILPLIAAVAAGNTVILKPSRSSGACLEVLDEMLSDCFPKEHVKVFKMTQGDNYNILDEKFDFIFFTGGPDTGKKVLEAAAKNITPAAMELGGKCPCIVHNDADVELAAARTAMGKFINAGQTCISPDYALVHEKIKDSFIDALKKRIEKMYGTFPEMSRDYGRIINEKEFDRLCSYIEYNETEAGGKTDRKTRYIEPAIIINPPKDSAVMKDEIFGPVLPVITYSKAGEAVEFIKNGEKPLVLYLFTRSSRLQERVLNETSSGGACINDTVVHMASPGLPFGGAGMSGFGRYRGKYGFDTFSNLKSVMKQTTLFDMSMRYPPVSAAALKLFRKILR